jgi:uncharacterized membrane protein
MKTLIPTNVARYVYAAVMAIFGLFHFMGAQDMAGMIPGWLPGGIVWVYITGAALLAAAIALFINKKARLAMYLLALMLILFIAFLHIPAMNSADECVKMGAMPNLLKDLALAAAAIVIGNGLDE